MAKPLTVEAKRFSRCECLASKATSVQDQASSRNLFCQGFVDELKKDRAVLIGRRFDKPTG